MNPDAQAKRLTDPQTRNKVYNILVAHYPNAISLAKIKMEYAKTTSKPFTDDAMRCALKRLQDRGSAIRSKLGADNNVHWKATTVAPETGSRVKKDKVKVADPVLQENGKLKVLIADLYKELDWISRSQRSRQRVAQPDGYKEWESTSDEVLQRTFTFLKSGEIT